MDSNFPVDSRETISKFSLVYSGDSFERGYNIKELSDNLISMNHIIGVIFDIAREERLTSNSSYDIKEIFLNPEKSSFIENISIILSNPEIRGMIFTLVVGLFYYLLNKRDFQKNEVIISEKIYEKILRNINAEDLKNIYNPIRKAKTNVLSAKSIKGDYVLVKNENVLQLDEKIKELSEINKESVEEKLVSGYICAINVDTNNLRFHPAGENRSYPLLYKGNVKDLIKRVDKKETYIMKIRKINGFLKDFELIDKSENFIQLNQF